MVTTKQVSVFFHLFFRSETCNHIVISATGYGSNFGDWTSFDPAIVSFRQFSFMNGPNQPGGDMFLSAQQQQNQLNQQNIIPQAQAQGIFCFDAEFRF